MYDVAVIGLGPAGAVFAKALSSEFKVVAIDKKGQYSDFKKTCGGLLSPDAQKLLKKLDITLSDSVILNRQFPSVKTFALDSENIKSYSRDYININRHLFDMELISHIPSNVDIQSNSRCSKIVRTPRGFDVFYVSDGTENMVSARCIVGADGADSIVRRTLFPDKKIRRYVAVQQSFELTDGSFEHSYSCIFDPENTDCYAWSLSKDDRFIFGGAFPAENCRSRFESLKEKMKAYGFEYGKLINTEACLVLRPSSFKDFCTGNDNAFLIGEAAGFISPSSLEGISSGILSGKLLADIINSKADSPNKKYHRATLPLRIKITLKLLKCPFMYNPSIRKLVMKSGLLTVNTDKKDDTV